MVGSLGRDGGGRHLLKAGERRGIFRAQSQWEEPTEETERVWHRLPEETVQGSDTCWGLTGKTRVLWIHLTLTCPAILSICSLQPHAMNTITFRDRYVK